MWVLYGLLGLLALLLVLLSIPVWGVVSYDGEFLIRFWVLGFPITLVPLPKKEKKKTPAEESTKKKKDKEKKEEKPSIFKELVDLIKQDDVSGTLYFFGQVAALAGTTLGRLLRSITVTRLDLQMRIATPDAAVTAQRYGQVCSVLYPALAGIEHWVRIRRRYMRVEPNFLLEDSAVRFDIRLHLSLWRLLGAAIALLWGFLMIKEESNTQNNEEVS